MKDIVQRLRTENTMHGYYDAPSIQEEAADEIERLRAALREYVATVVGAEGVAFIDRMPTAELRLIVDAMSLGEETPFEDRWDNA